MSGTLLVSGAKQLLTLRGLAGPRRGAALQELGIIHDGALLIDHGRIVEVGLTRRVENLAQIRPCEEIDATGRIVIPGFVDCHTHLVRGVPARDVSLGDTGDAEAALAGHALRNVSAKRLESRARVYVNAMARHGTTTLEAKSGYGLDERSEVKILRAQARLDGEPLDIASTFVTARTIPAGHGDSAAYLTWICRELLPAIRRRTFARFAALGCGYGVFDPEQSRYFLKVARELGFQLKIDAAGFPAEEAVRLATEEGVTSVDGLEHVGAADAELLAQSKAVAVLLAGDAFWQSRGGGGCGRLLIDAGAAVALGTNFDPDTDSTCSMAAAVAMACAHLGMRPEEAISAATFNAACTVGAGNVAGSLEVGKWADFIVLNTADYRDIPHRFGMNLVNCTVKRGVVIYQEGRVGRP
jgi:imidazolonepropionase